MKTVKWVSGVESMISKKEARKEIGALMNGESFPAEKRHFVLLSKRAGLTGWKNAVHLVGVKSDKEVVYSLLNSGSHILLSKSNLRRAADLVQL